MKTRTILSIAALLMCACSPEPVQPPAATAAPKPVARQGVAAFVEARSVTPQPSLQPSAKPSEALVPVQAGALEGTVLETFDGGGYTYMQLKTASGREWAAVREANVRKGQKVTVLAQMTKDDFRSSSLDRTFDRIIFGTMADAAVTASSPAAGPMQAGMMPMPQAHPPMEMMAATAKQHITGGATDVGDVEVARAEGANGRTVAELWSGRATLADKPVVVRGKVVKFLGGIMGRNWLHVRDGSGSPDGGDHDITVTTAEVANVGETVVVSGLLRVDKDFGAGYRYSAIIEDAQLSK